MTGPLADLTHAGGVVFRLDGGEPQFLLVTARRNASIWVYPKGHIEPGETAEEGAVREVREESGVLAENLGPLTDLRLDVAGEEQRIRYFLMRAVGDGAAAERRRVLWLPAADALRRLSFPESRSILEEAIAALAQRGLF